MKRKAFLLVSILIGFACLQTQGQGHSMSYKDSAIVFLNDFINASKLKDAVILNNSVYDRFDSMFRRHGYFDELPSRIYKREPGGVRVDSISITKKEIRKIIVPILAPTFTWTKEYLPLNELIDQKTIDSLVAKGHKTAPAIGDFQNKANYDYEALKKDSAYLQYFETIKDLVQFLQKGYWILSKPVFIKNGSFAAIYSRNIYFSNGSMLFANHHLALYRNENGKWVFFGNIVSGNWN